MRSAELSDALLTQLLPEGQEGRPVLLACDDQALAAACARLDPKIDPERALRDSLASVAPLTKERGIGPLLGSLRGPPADFPVLCACVLAASRMHPDEVNSTQAYYVRLAELLGIELRDSWPGVAGFEEVPCRFEGLAEWLAGEEGGSRGTLILPERAEPPRVGYPISQAVLRRVDRDRLGHFFDQQRLALSLGRDPLRLLRASAVRHELTATAQHQLGQPELEQALRATLTSAYAAWDGTVVDAEGRASRCAELRLSLSPDGLGLHASLASGAATVKAPQDGSLAIPEAPEEVRIPLAWLRHCAEAPLTMAAESGPPIRILPGRLILFEVSHAGFWMTSVPGESPLIVLTCDPNLTSLEWGARRAAVDLPEGWAAICDVEPEEFGELVPTMRPEQVEVAVHPALEGGLQLEPGTWLVGFPPYLRGELPEPAPADLIDPAGRRHQLGELDRGRCLSLEELAHSPGAYAVEVSDQRLEFELAASGARAGVGSLAHYPATSELSRSGAIDAETASLWESSLASISGAKAEPASEWSPPLTIRAEAPVHAIRSGGEVTVHGPAPFPHWARLAGLIETNSCSIPEPETVSWLCVASRRSPRVLALEERPGQQITEEVLELVARFSEAAVIGDPGAAERWQVLCTAARRWEQELDG